MATVYPKHVIVAANADDLAAVKKHLDEVGYKAAETTNADRTDKDVDLTVEVAYPSWEL